MIYGERIRQARELRGVTQTALARAIGLHPSALAHAEAGRSSLSEASVEALAKQTEFPVAFFHAPPSWNFPLGSLLFRAQAAMTSRERLQAFRYAQTVYEAMEKLAAHVTRIPMTLPSVVDDPVAAARVTRSALGLSPDTPIPHVIDAVERAGVAVIGLPISLERRDAFSSWVGDDPRVPLIVITVTSAGDRLRFNVAHELAHVVMHRRVFRSALELERQAHAFAAEFLMPTTAMMRVLVQPLTLTALAALKPAWGVSIQALIRRARDLALISANQYRYLCQQISTRGWKKVEPSNLDVPVERPRALRKMAELLYGDPINYPRLAADVALDPMLIRAVLEAHASAEGDTGQRSLGQLGSSPTGRVIRFRHRS